MPKKGQKKEPKFPIKVKDRDINDRMDRLSNEQAGIIVVINQLSRRLGEIQGEVNRIFRDLYEKHNIPEKYRGMLTYQHANRQLILKKSRSVSEADYHTQMGKFAKEDD